MAGCGCSDSVANSSKASGGGRATKDLKSERADLAQKCHCRSDSVGKCTCGPAMQRQTPRGSRRSRGARARLRGRAFARDLADPERYHKLLLELGVPALSVRGLRIGEDGRSLISVERAGEPCTLRFSELTKTELSELSTTILWMRPEEPKPKRDKEDGTSTVAAAMLRYLEEGGTLTRAVGSPPVGESANSRVEKDEADAPSAASNVWTRENPKGGPKESELPARDAGPSGTCFRYRAWRRRRGTERSTPCPAEFVSRHPDYLDTNYQEAGDWEVFDFVACLPEGFSYERATGVLEEEVGSDVQAALWALVGEEGIDEQSTILGQNLAPDAVEPLWNSWSATDTSYAPQTTDAPRRSLTLRTLDLILSLREGVPKTREGFDLHHLVLDPIAAGAMSYRIYERYFPGQATPEDAYLEELIEFANAVAGLRSDLDGIVLRLTALRIRLLADLLAALSDIVVLLDSLRQCVETGQGCEQAAADLDAAWQSFSDARATLLQWAQALPAAVFELIGDILRVRDELNELTEAHQDYWDETVDVENAFMNAVFRRSLCKGPPHLRWDGGPESVAPSPDCLAECPRVDSEIDLRDLIQFPFRWDTAGQVGDFEVEGANNHGIVPRGDEIAEQLGARRGEHPFDDLHWGNRVWVCQTHLDRAAMMFDWLVALATRHYAYSYKVEDPSLWIRHLLAANTTLRMALGVAARWAALLLHETAHNVSVFHCNEPVERELGLTGLKVGCVQDIVAEAWLVNAMARKGLPPASHSFHAPVSDGDPETSKLVWNIHFGWEVGDCGGILSPAPVGTYDIQFQPYYRERQVECEQSQFVDDSTVDTMHSVARALAIVGAWQLSPALVGAAYLLDFVADQLGELPEEGTAAEAGDILFNIDRPLEMGGQVTDCCFLNLNFECASRTKSPCWSRDEAPAGAAWRGCCCVEADGDWPWSDKQKEPSILRRRYGAELTGASVRTPIHRETKRSCVP